MKLLLVDDSSTMRRIQINILNKLGVTDIDEAEDGNDALDRLACCSTYDAMLLDWNMPNMDGITCLKEVRADPKYSGIKVIMCTSESEKTNIVEAIKAGANDYIVKPFTPETIQAKLLGG